jgi:hypothetical protein
MIYALFFAVISAVAAVYGFFSGSASGALFGKVAPLASFAMAIVCLALAKFDKRDDLPFP